jgi:hypothetical protein
VCARGCLCAHVHVLSSSSYVGVCARKSLGARVRVHVCVTKVGFTEMCVLLFTFFCVRVCVCVCVCAFMTDSHPHTAEFRPCASVCVFTCVCVCASVKCLVLSLFLSRFLSLSLSLSVCLCVCVCVCVCVFLCTHIAHTHHTLVD